MQLACKQRGPVVVLQIQHGIATHDRRLQPGAGRRPCIDLYLDGQNFIAMWRQLQLKQQASKSHKGAVHNLPIVDLQVDRITFSFEGCLNHLQIPAQIILLGRML